MSQFSCDDFGLKTEKQGPLVAIVNSLRNNRLGATAPLNTQLIMKQLLSIVALLGLLAGTSTNAHAQLANGSVAPDWTMTDINGNSHNLYSILDSGYTVVLDFSATWCGPCWTYHNSGALEDLWTDHGPGGTDEVRVFMIEGDANTNNADLLGNTSASQGDWTNGVDYPIIDDASITGSYQIAYWPTIYSICPDRLVTETGQASPTTHYEHVGNCPTFNSLATNDAVTRAVSGVPNSTCLGTTITPQMQLMNHGSSALTSATLVTRLDGNVISSTPWNGFLPQFGTDMVTLPTITNIATGSHTLEIYTEFPNGTLDDTPANDLLTTTFTTYVTASSSFEVRIQTDAYASEITWNVQNSGGGTVASGTLTASDNNSLYTSPFSASTDDCYTFTINDSYGDGILGGGYAEVMDGSGSLLTRVEGDSYGSVGVGDYTKNSFAVTATATDAGCGSNNGSASATGLGGTPPLTYSWSNGGSGASIFNLGAGTYTVTFTDGGGSSTTSQVTVGGGNLVIAGSATATNCGSNIGTASVSVSTGSAPYTYAWSNGGSGSNLNNLPAGTYTVTVTDAAGCTEVETMSVTGGGGFAVATSSIDAGCGAATGVATVGANGGTTPYTYQWGANTGNQSNASATNLAAGTYNCTITDAAGCVEVTSVTIVSVGDVQATLAANNASCELDNGSATAVPTVGTAPFSYTWSNGATGATATNLPAGTYTVTIIDGDGCSFTDQISVSTTDPVQAIVQSALATCGTSNGSATVTPTLGLAPYSYQWDVDAGSGTTSTAGSLAAGTYSATVTDANGCTLVTAANVSNANAPGLVSVANDVSCNGGADGALTVVANGGVLPYEYAWSSGGTEATEGDLEAGSYTITVTDDAGCITIETYDVDEPDPIVLSSTINNTSSAGTSDGAVTVAAQGGAGPYTYLWQNGSTGPTIDNLWIGFYTVTVTDQDGCTTTETYEVTVAVGIADPVASAHLLVYPNPTAGQLVVEGDKLSQISVYNAVGQLVHTAPLPTRTTTRAVLNLSHLGAGLYILAITNDEHRYTRRVVVE